MEEGEIKYKRARKVFSKISEFGDKGTLTIRNAITAEKIENFVAPALWKNNTKPTIAMVWAHAHYGIKELLLHPERRTRILTQNKLEKWVHADYPKSFSFGLDRDGKMVELKEHRFDVKPPKFTVPSRTSKQRVSFIKSLFRRR